MTIGTIMELTLAAAFTAIGAAKIVAFPAVRREAQHLGFTAGRYRLIGVAELLAAAGLLTGLFWTPAAIAASVGLVVLLIGAVLVLRRAGDPPARALPAVAFGLAAAATATLLLTGI
ncbi:invasion protein [Streptomyces sp. A7024]|uniref:Invasion protein n=1 Tax=Streptomyces coryli TaxID=1128680 RepID=A0A6G4U3N0_9ACTN|nr:DoxX family protein [Streptomyces coryli]NGN65831.1 invasion protein [Streptomyces coryli]